MSGSPPATRPNPGALAIGTAPLGGLYAPVDDADAQAALVAAAQGGVTHFDTAPHYGRGLAEQRLGSFLAHADDPDRFTVSTKVGRFIHPLTRRAPDDLFLGAPPGESSFDFSPSAVHTQLAQSRRRLGRDHIDIVFVHDPDDHLDAALGAFDTLAKLRDRGDIDAVGVGTNSASVVTSLIDRVGLDVVLLAGRITLLETSGERVAAHCAANGIPVFVAGVFQSGILAGGDSDTYDYLPAPALIRRRVGELAAVCSTHDVALHTAAAAHPRRITGVTTTLIGVRSPAESADALADRDAALSPEFWSEIDAVRSAWTHDQITRSNP